jgi:Predicted ATPase
MNSINNEVNRKKEMLMNEYFSNKNTMCRDLFDDYDKLKDKIAADKKTLSAYTRERLGSNNIMRQSNGETALLFWEREIQENAIYILDEPENSLSAENQLKLKKYIEESARFYKCQFILATHSPLLLSLNEAVIYDLDSLPVKTKKWFELDNVRIYFDFFNENKDKF